MIKAFASPSSYVQGKGVLFQSKLYLESFGTKPLLITGGHVYANAGFHRRPVLASVGHL